jgi:hypothetical protein
LALLQSFLLFPRDWRFRYLSLSFDCQLPPKDTMAIPSQSSLPYSSSSSPSPTPPPHPSSTSPPSPPTTMPQPSDAGNFSLHPPPSPAQSTTPLAASPGGYVGVIAPQTYIGQAWAPHPQLSLFLSGLGHITLPDSSLEVWIQGGKYGIILATDTREASARDILQLFLGRYKGYCAAPVCGTGVCCSAWGAMWDGGDTGVVK